MYLLHYKHGTHNKQSYILDRTQYVALGGTFV